MGLAYEIVINSNPCIAYLMEENTMAMQALVIAHAAYGHNSFFKGNYLFRMWTDAVVDRRLPGLREELHRRVRGAARRGRGGGRCSTACHALMNHGVDRYQPPAASCRWRRNSARRKEREAISAAAGQRPVAHAAARGRQGRATQASAKRFPDGAAGEPAVLHREERAAAGALAARDRAHRAQDRAVLLSAAPDAGDERRLGDVLALHDAQHACTTKAT